jgi:hypothetical protein
VILTDSRLKIDRANKHIADIKARIALLHETDSARVKVDPETGCEVLIHDFSDLTAFDDIALMLGDAVHNLNCALDYTWLQTIDKLMPVLIDDRAKFPVRKNIKELEGWMIKAGIDSSSPNLFRFMLDIVKPCEGGDNAIWPIHTLDINDKHRLLIPVLSNAHIKGIRIVDQYGENWPGDGTSERFQRPPYVITYERGLHVKEKGKLTANIVVEDAKLPYLLDIPETIMHYSHFILRIVETFETFLQTQISG